MRKIPGEQPPVSNPNSLSEWLTRLVVNINAALDQSEYPYNFVSVTDSRSTRGNQVLVCKNTTLITITLEVSPPIGTNVHIKRRDAAIDVVGTIDGVVNKTINVLNYSMNLYYDGIDWSEI